MQRQQCFFRRTVGVMDEERPVEPLGERDEIGAMAFESRLVTRSQLLDAADGHALITLYGGEFRAAVIGERLLGGIEDLDEVAAHTLTGDGFETLGRRLDRLEPIAEEDAFGKAAQPRG